MATMGALLVRLQTIIGETTSRHWPPSTLLTFLLEGCRQVVNDCPVAYTAEWTTSAQTAQRDYTLPDSFVPPLWAVVWDYSETTEKALNYLPLKHAPSFNAAGASTPMYYTYIYSGGQLVLRLMPTPSTAAVENILVYCSRQPGDLTTADNCPLHPMTQDCVVSWGKYRAWEEWEQYDRAAAAFQEYQIRLGGARKLLTAPIAAYPLSVRGSLLPLPESERP